MVSNLGELVATAQLDISPFINNTRQLQRFAKGLDSSLKTVENSFKGQKDKLTGLRMVYDQTGVSLKGYQAVLEKQKQSFEGLRERTGDLSKATEKQRDDLIGAQSAMTATAARVAELQSKYDALGKEIAIQSSVFTIASEKLIKHGDRLKSFGDSVHGVGKALTAGITTPIVVGAGYAVKAAAQYESAFAGVKKTVDETATTSYEQLSDNIRQLSKELPASAAEIAKVVEVSGQLGIVADDIMSFSKTAIDLGESTNLSAEDAATAIAKIANITKMGADDYQRYGSSLVALGKSYCPVAKKLAS